jgi:hypothetical protein
MNIRVKYQGFQAILQWLLGYYSEQKRVLLKKKKKKKEKSYDSWNFA